MILCRGQAITHLLPVRQPTKEWYMPFNTRCTGKMIYPSSSACWRYQQDQMLEIMRGWCGYELRDLNDAHERAKVCGIPDEDVRQGVKGIVLSEPLTESSAKAQAVYKRGQWPRFYFTKNGLGGIRRKTYLENVGGRVPTNLWQYSETGHTDEAKKEIGFRFLVRQVTV